MPKFRVINDSENQTELEVEPCAFSEVLLPKDEVIIDYVEPAEFDFYIGNKGVLIDIVSEKIIFTTKEGSSEFRIPLK
ncbi:hypothetical protein [Methylopila sp. M107]|uniref:hypothetical protein n=1 Tax=Methylopila sp. M107 TaxID=1101190 RepID=UPI0012DC588A|nr:hypothetical protein [Methylopila sp. M107]